MKGSLGISTHRMLKFFSASVMRVAKGTLANAYLYKSFSIPIRLRLDVSMNLVTGLPNASKFKHAFVVVDRFFKMAHFMRCKKIDDVSHVANLYFSHIVHLHGFLEVLFRIEMSCLLVPLG